MGVRTGRHYFPTLILSRETRSVNISIIKVADSNSGLSVFQTQKHKRELALHHYSCVIRLLGPEAETALRSLFNKGYLSQVDQSLNRRLQFFRYPI